MKKITSEENIHFKVSGTEDFVITPEGVLVSDKAARVLEERLGSHIKVIPMEPETMPTPEAAPEVAPVATPPEDAPAPAPEPTPEEVVAPTAETTPEEAAA